MLPNTTAQPGVVLRWRQCAGVQLLLTSRRASRVIGVYTPQLTTPDPRSMGPISILQD